MPGLPTKALRDRIWTPPRLEQPESGFRFTTDALLLASFAARFPTSSWCDLGTGNGVLAHELAIRKPDATGVAVERQSCLSRYARVNLKGLPVTLIEGDLRAIPWHAASLDLIVSNPPYYEVDAGQINRDRMLAQARHTFYGTVVDFATATQSALSESGVFCFIFPSLLVAKPLERLVKQGWHLVEKLTIRSFADRDVKRVCLSLAKTPKPLVNRELTLYGAHRVFTRQALRFLANSELD